MAKRFQRVNHLNMLLMDDEWQKTGNWPCLFNKLPGSLWFMATKTFWNVWHTFYSIFFLSVQISWNFSQKPHLTTYLPKYNRSSSRLANIHAHRQKPWTASWIRICNLRSGGLTQIIIFLLPPGYSCGTPQLSDFYENQLHAHQLINTINSFIFWAIKVCI